MSISVQPDSYVLEKGHFLTVEINSYLPIHLGTDVYIIIIYGEEVLRQRFLFTRNNVDIFENSVLLNYLRLHETFTNESSNLTGILSADSFCPDFKSNITELVASLKLVWIRMYLGSLSSPVLSTSLSEGLVSLHKSTFEPMNPE